MGVLYDGLKKIDTRQKQSEKLKEQENTYQSTNKKSS